MEVVDSGTPEADDTDIATMDIQDTNSTAINDTVSVPTSDTTSDPMLTVSDDEFWEGTSPLEFGELPALQDAVTVAGYPIGGDTISVTSGVVSRMEYVHGSTELLGLQIGAAINSGSSGGPAFDGKGKCVVLLADINIEYNQANQMVVLQTKTAKAATLDILLTHCMPSATSDDLRS